MRNYDAATVAHLASRAGIVSRVLVWIEARDKTTGAPHNLGVWSGEEPMNFQIGGQLRPYKGAGMLLQAEPVASAPGLEVSTYRVGLSAIAADVENLVKGYQTRFAPIEVHRALFDPQTRQLVSEPHRVFRGFVNQVRFPRSVPGGDASCAIDAVSETRTLTRSLALRKSEASQKMRGGDEFRRYGDISGSVPVFWGEKRQDLQGN